MRVLRRSLAVACSIVLIPGASVVAQFIDAKLDYRVTNVGKIRQVLTNMGTFDKGRTRYPGLINAEFPPGSDEEHLFQGGIWIGAISPTGDTLVSQSEAHFTPHEFFPTNKSWDSIWTGSKGDTLHLPYWQNYECISDRDYVCRYSDYNILNIDNHTPLYLDIVQTTYSWSSGQLAEFLLHKYYIVATKIPLKDAYIGFWMHSSIGNIGVADNFIDEYTRWKADYKMAIAEDSPGGNDGAAFSPIGFSVMAPTDAPSWSKACAVFLPQPRAPPAMRVTDSTRPRRSCSQSKTLASCITVLLCVSLPITRIFAWDLLTQVCGASSIILDTPFHRPSVPTAIRTHPLHPLRTTTSVNFGRANSGTPVDRSVEVSGGSTRWYCRS